MAEKLNKMSIEMTANVEVIGINSYLVANVIKHAIKLQNMLDKASYTKQVRTENGDWTDEVDENGNKVIKYRSLSDADMVDLVQTSKFLNILTKEFTGEDDK